MIGYDIRFCDYCHDSIVAGQRWVREKIYDPRSTDQDAAYRHFHAEVLGGEEVSCWEKYWAGREIARGAVAGRNTGNKPPMRVVA